MSLLNTMSSSARVLHALSVFVIAAMALSAIAYSIACAFGFAPWLTLSVTFGALAVPAAGMYLQIGIAVILGAMAFFLPTQSRIMSLEQSHRRFQITMDDVARAYHLCHTADRAGLFTTSSEFDQVRERLAYLRDHPDLEKLEPGEGAQGPALIRGGYLTCMVNAGWRFYVSPNRAPRIQASRLKHIAIGARAPRFLRADSVHRDVPCRGLFQIGHDPQKRGLATARGSNEANEVALVNVQRDILERMHRPVIGLESQAKVFSADDGIADQVLASLKFLPEYSLDRV